MEFGCDQCAFKTTVKLSLKNHVSKVHVFQINEVYSLTENAQQESRPKAIHDVEEISMGNVTDQGKKVAINSSDNEEPRDQRGHPKRSKAVGQDKINNYDCEACGKVFNQKHNMERHIEYVHQAKDKNLKCSKCSYATFNKGDLRKHIKIVHEKIKNHVCQECKYATYQKPDMTRHLFSVHNIGDKNPQRQEYSYECEECGIKFTRNYNLKQHRKHYHEMNEATESIELQCTLCEYVTKWKGSMNKHIKFVHNKKNLIKDHQCSRCGYRTHQKAQLTNHIKGVHEKIKDIVCQVCDFATSYKSKLVRHVMTVHQTQKNHKCSECEFATNHSNNLKTHIKAIHRNVRDHQCPQCNYKAKQKIHLVKHLKRAHRC